MDPSQLPGGADPSRFGPGLNRVHEALGPLNFIEHLFTLMLCLLVLAALAFLIYRLVSRPGGGGGWMSQNTMALRELELRYARGEIGREDFLQRRADLTTPVLPPAAPAGPPASAPPPAAPPAAQPPPVEPPPAAPPPTPRAPRKPAG